LSASLFDDDLFEDSPSFFEDFEEDPVFRLLLSVGFRLDKLAFFLAFERLSSLLESELEDELELELDDDEDEDLELSESESELLELELESSSELELSSSVSFSYKKFKHKIFSMCKNKTEKASSH
jgi:hypothetical protein